MWRKIGKKLRWGWILGLVVEGVGGALVEAQTPTLEARVDRTSISLEETFILTVTIQAEENIPTAPILPDLPDFDVSGPSTSQQIVMSNGRMAATMAWTYQLFPQRAGQFTIGAITLRAGGKTVQSRPLQVTVTDRGRTPSPSSRGPFSSGPERDSRGAGAPAAGRPPLWVEATADPPNPYVNQQVTLTVAAYSRYRTFNIDFDPPQLSGFRVFTIDDPQLEGREMVEGEQYFVVRQKFVLFPLQSGPLTIPPVWVRFELGFFNQRELRTRPLTLEVRPLPKAGSPADFKGAVGQFQISAQVDKTTVPVGEPITLTAEITGRGDFETVPPVELPDQPGFQRFDPSQREEKPGLVDGRVTGRKTAEVVLVPQQEGDYSLGPLRLSYFNPDRGRYQVATSPSLRITVTPGANRPDASRGGFAPERVRILRRDIRYLKPDLARVLDEGRFALLSPVRLGGHALPLLLLLIMAGIKRRREMVAADTPWGRGVRSRRAAQQGFREAVALMQPEHSVAFHAAVARGLTEFLAMQINVPGPSISSDTVGDRLAPFGVPASLVQEARGCLARCEFARFSGEVVTEEEMKDTLERAQRFVAAWERMRPR